MTKAQAKHKIALALDLINEVDAELNEQSAAYHAVRSMATSASYAVSALTEEEIQEQAEHLVNFRSYSA